VASPPIVTQKPRSTVGYHSRPQLACHPVASTSSRAAIVAPRRSTTICPAKGGATGEKVGGHGASAYVPLYRARMAAREPLRDPYAPTHPLAADAGYTGPPSSPLSHTHRRKSPDGRHEAAWRQLRLPGAEAPKSWSGRYRLGGSRHLQDGVGEARVKKARPSRHPPNAPCGHNDQI